MSCTLSGTRGRLLVTNYRKEGIYHSNCFECEMSESTAVAFFATALTEGNHKFEDETDRIIGLSNCIKWYEMMQIMNP